MISYTIILVISSSFSSVESFNTSIDQEVAIKFFVNIREKPNLFIAVLLMDLVLTLLFKVDTVIFDCKWTIHY